MSLISLKNVEVRHGELTALHSVNFSIDKGEIVTVVGPNGSGKSTLIRTIVGALKPSKGQMEHAEGLRIGYVPQKLFIDPTLPISVKRFMSLPRSFPHADVEEALRHTGASGLADRPMSALSGGQFQRVLLARAILEKPDLLILDEATQGLDQPGAASFYRLIETLRTELGCAVLMVSHDLHVVMSASDRVICMNGHICCEGAPEVVASAPEYRALFGSGTDGALALYRHTHTHSHDGDCDHDHDHEDHAHAG
ncbi:ATP-binding cassette domain-containing protein [Actibacterium pelagium]|uniref:Zinc import ATP-binding protein ZnuC n=1 Tax=Actibacterium pelagium TaxID=2029103 RepID=A0A917AB84_9RHOB|nr:metal ABC transporter ATP-binding protein [Actibacterium pelagium]GGE39685.1 zinc import ATP-binding protein ZnuC [Actibacterium pelagium]